MTVAEFQAVTVGSTQETDVSLVSNSPAEREFALQVWTTLTSSGAAGRPRGRSTLIVFPGLKHALNVRIYQSDEDVAIEDPATGVFGSGDDLPSAVQDFQDALMDHLAVLEEEETLAPHLQRQLEMLRSYFNSP